MVLVDAAEGCYGFIAIAAVGVAKVEGENRLIKKPLIEHIIERRDNLIDADGVIAQAHDTVEPAEGKSKARLGGCFSEVLMLHCQVSDLERILGNVAAQRARSISDLKFRAIALVGGRCIMVVFAVQVAGDRVAIGRWDPEIRAASIEHNLEGLGRSAQRDL